MRDLKASPTYSPKAGVLNVYRCEECQAYHVGHKFADGVL